MELFSSMSLLDAVVDEIALEGLDGITLEALWDRLALRFHEKEALSEKLMEQIWDICLQVRDLSFYQLETPREKLVIFNRYDYVDPDFGIILEPETIPDDIYTHCPVDDAKKGIKGSCATYYTRKDIGSSVRSLNVHEAQENYGRSLVIVASQDQRKEALMDKNVCPVLELTVTQYCFLERVGRSRYHGEVTQGKLSLSLLQEDPRSLFYHRKFLLRHKLVTKQLHHQKTSGHSCSGSLIHLPRFFVERRPKVIYLAQKVIEILKKREHQVAEYSEIKKELGIENSIKKLFKTSCFQNVVKTDLVVPYRMLYPHAEKIEWQRKNNPQKEKMLRVVQLIDSNIDANDIWNKDEVLEDDEIFELDNSEQKCNKTFLNQANRVVEASWHDGLGQTELARKMGLPKLQSRTFFRSLAKTEIVAIYMNDMGRQRVTKYVSRRYEDSSRMSKQFKREVFKMRQLAEVPIEKSTAKETNPVDDTKAKELSAGPLDEAATKVSENNRVTESTENIDKTEKTAEIAPTEKFATRDSTSFDAATKILRKYNLSSCGLKYKRTFQNIAEFKDAETARCRKRPRLAEKDPPIDEDPAQRDIESKIPEKENNFAMKVEESQLPATPAALPRQDISSLIDNLNNVDMKNVSNITYRLLKRANIIIESVKEHKVIDDLTKLMKMITEEEEKEGYDVKIDKKSLIRLLQRLAKDDLVKNIKLTLSTNGKEKCLTFICDPSIDVTHTVIRSAVEQAKIKFCLMGAQKVETVLQSNSEKLEFGENGDEFISTEKLNEIDKESKKALPFDLVFDTKVGRSYGYSPKFIRMQTLHTFLFYLVYEHPGKSEDSKSENPSVKTLRSKGILIDDNLEKEMSVVYNSEVGWKMFVPPLPQHNGWPLGWALMCDILLRMPLSIFLKVHKVSYVIPELEEYRNHPIRKHLLVKDMPASIRNVLLIRRKYIYSVHDAITRLCYIGLVQFGPQKLKEKDKVFVYINRNTELMDTTTSAAHYHKIEERMYSVTKFNFTSLHTVDKYWYRLWTTCVNTRLGGRLVVEGKDIVLEELNKKLEMIEATKARAPDEAALMDSGHVPGDRMGAAGIDSAFFAHLKRNWTWESSNYPFKNGCSQFGRRVGIFEGERDAYMSRVKSKPLKFTEYHGLRKITGPTTVDANELKKSQVSVAKNVGQVANGGKKTKKYAWSSCGKSGGASRQRSYVRRVLPRRSHIRARVKYDEIDYSALQRMDKLRVDWDTREDNILLVCKVAMMYLCPNPRRQLITFTAVRDVLRSYSLTSHNKTARACQRRLLYMLKKPQTFHSVTLGVEELKQNFYVNRRFGDVVDSLKKEYRSARQCDQQLTMIFRDLVAFIAKKNYDISDIESAPMNLATSTLEEFNLFHGIKYATKPSPVQGFHDDTTNDIHSATINSVIHSSMCCGKDRRSWAYQLFRIYQQYPEWLLRRSMAKIRADQMISVKKHYVFAMRKQTNSCMPMSSSQYQLSSGYVQKFNTKFPYSAFKESYEFFVKLATHCHDTALAKQAAENEHFQDLGVEAVPVNGGTVAALHDYINIDELDIDLEIPQHIIMLDPEFTKDDERYIRIARRYQDILRNIEHFEMDEIFEASEEKSEGDATSETTKPVAAQPEEGVSGSSTKPREEEKKEKPLENPRERKIEKADSKVLEPKKAPMVPKFQDFETHANTDTEAFESDREVNFEVEDESEYEDEDIDELEDEDDEFIRFLDGTKVRITSEDIERSGLKINDDVRGNLGKIANKDLAEKTRMTLINADSASNDEKSDEERRKDSCDTSAGNCVLIKEEKMEVGESSQLVEDDVSAQEKRDRPLRVNEMIESVRGTVNTQGPNYRAAEVNDADKRCTRIALLKMREELNDLTPNDSHHAHEYFVLNMFKIFCSLHGRRVTDATNLSTIGKIEIPSELLPLRKGVYDELVEGIREFAVFPKTLASYGRFKRELHGTECFKRGMDAVYEFIREKRDVGASLDQLAATFYPILGDSLYEMLSLLKEDRLVLRSGVKNTRYIHQKYADPWVIHSYKIMRLQKESLPNVPPGSFYVIADEKKGEPAENNGNGNDVSIEEETDESAGKKNRTTSQNEGDSASSSQRKLQKSRTCLLQTKDVYRAAKQLDLDTAEEIMVVVRPWIRVDGALNRRVLDRMLGGVLAYCLMHPGVYLSKIQEKFAPAIQPFHIKELVEMLVKLECLEIGYLRKTRVTLFSKPSAIKPTFSGLTDHIERSEEDLIVEPVLGATLKFAAFLSNGTYSSDFLAQ